MVRRRSLSSGGGGSADKAEQAWQEAASVVGTGSSSLERFATLFP